MPILIRMRCAANHHWFIWVCGIKSCPVHRLSSPPSSLSLLDLEHTTTMSSYSYPSGESSKESTDSDPFFAPKPQTADAPSPESFDDEVDNEVGEIDLTWSFDHFDDFFSTYRDTIPVNPTPALTYATEWSESSYETASSQYSHDASPSVYSTLSEIETCSSVNDGYTTDEFIYSESTVSSNGPAAFPPVDPVQAQSDYGTSEFPTVVEISPGDPSTVQQDFAPEPFPVMPAQVEPFKPFKCSQCPFGMSEAQSPLAWEFILGTWLTHLASLRA